jgi:hypothetical protein
MMEKFGKKEKGNLRKLNKRKGKEKYRPCMKSRTRYMKKGEKFPLK